jgi:hypothetical protein
MRITSYGLFWRESEIEWYPGQGIKDSFRLLGRVGTNAGKIKIADFRRQQGIYILYDEYGPSYVGLTRQQGLGKRLKDHMTDHLEGRWDRFSWFGFNPIGVAGDDGVLRLSDLQTEVSEQTHTTIGDLEALLIRAIGPKLNTAWMKFKDAVEWSQIEREDIDRCLAKVRPVTNKKSLSV